MTIVTRIAKGAPLEHAELDNNFVELDSRLILASTQISTNTGQIGLLPKFYKDGSNNIDGITDGTTNLPMIRNPVEMLSNSAIGFSCISTAVDENLVSFTLKAGIVGPNSVLHIEPAWSFSNSANNKNLKVKVGGVTVYSADRTGTAIKEVPLIIIANRNSLASQIRVTDSNYILSSTNGFATYTINFASDVVVQITGNRANSSDTLKLEHYRILHFVGD